MSKFNPNTEVKTIKEQLAELRTLAAKKVCRKYYDKLNNTVSNTANCSTKEEIIKRFGKDKLADETDSVYTVILLTEVRSRYKSSGTISLMEIYLKVRKSLSRERRDELISYLEKWYIKIIEEDTIIAYENAEDLISSIENAIMDMKYDLEDIDMIFF